MKYFIITLQLGFLFSQTSSASMYFIADSTDDFKGTGSSSSGERLGATLSSNSSGFTSYSGLRGFAGASASNGVVANRQTSLNFSFSEAVQGRFEQTGTGFDSPGVGQGFATGFVFRSTRATDFIQGETFSVTLSFDNGYTSGNFVGSSVTKTQPGISVTGAIIDEASDPNGSPFDNSTEFAHSMALAARRGLNNSNSAGVSGTDESIEITAQTIGGANALFAMSDPNFQHTVSNDFSGGVKTFNWVNDGGVATNPGGDTSKLNFLNDGDLNGLGAGFRDSANEFAFESVKFTWTAGTGGMSKDSVFRFSVDGMSVSTIPEPSSLLLLSTGALLLTVRRRKTT